MGKCRLVGTRRTGVARLVGVVQRQIPGLIDGTTGALDFPRVARALTILPVDDVRARRTRSALRLASVTHDPGTGVHTTPSRRAPAGNDGSVLLGRVARDPLSRRSRRRCTTTSCPASAFPGGCV